MKDNLSQVFVIWWSLTSIFVAMQTNTLSYTAGWESFFYWYIVDANSQSYIISDLSDEGSTSISRSRDKSAVVRYLLQIKNNVTRGIKLI